MGKKNKIKVLIIILTIIVVLFGGLKKHEKIKYISLNELEKIWNISFLDDNNGIIDYYLFHDKDTLIYIIYPISKTKIQENVLYEYKENYNSVPSSKTYIQRDIDFLQSLNFSQNEIMYCNTEFITYNINSTLRGTSIRIYIIKIDEYNYKIMLSSIYPEKIEIK